MTTQALPRDDADEEISWANGATNIRTSWQDNIFVGNPFLDDLLAWRHSPEGEQFAEFSDTLCDLMEDVQLDARKRQFIWPDGNGSISINPSRASSSNIPTSAVTGSRNI